MLMNAETESMAKMMGMVAIATSFAPIIFGNYWSQVAEEQQSYKKKIYTPIFSGALFPDRKTGRFFPGLVAAINF